MSNKELQLLADDIDSGADAGGLAQDLLQRNSTGGGVNGLDGDGVDGEGEDSMDDDMMDKISSSPSIDDGGYTLPISWPTRGQSLHPEPFNVVPESPSVSTEEGSSSSPFLESPAHFPLVFPRKDQDLFRSEDHHRIGEYAVDPEKRRSPVPYHQHLEFSSSPPDGPGPIRGNSFRDSFHDQFDDLEESFDEDLDNARLHDLLLPTRDSLLGGGALLNNNFDNVVLAPPPPDIRLYGPVSVFDSDSDDDMSIGLSELNDHNGDDDDDDDTEDISFSDHDRFVDSGWGGECLRETEEIDFEFVYALHTFVATVEGQANATKGETMVLLDDSNSYWWLVRVVRDGSIGRLLGSLLERH